MNSVTNLTVGILNLDPAQKDALSKCIANYSIQPNGFCERLGQFIYIIIENGKMYFGCSDFDKAIEAFEQKSLKIIPVPILYFMPNSAIRKTSEFGVNSLIKVNQYQTPAIPDAVTNYIVDNYTIEDIAKIAEQLIVHLLDKGVEFIEL